MEKVDIHCLPEKGVDMIEAVCVTVLLTAVSLVLVFLFERWK